MRRAALERARTVRVWRKHLQFAGEEHAASCVCELQAGHFRKGLDR